MNNDQKNLIGLSAIYIAHSLTTKSEAARTFFKERARELAQKAQEQKK